MLSGYIIEAYFSSIIPILLQKLSPGAIVVQCGADSLSQDPLGAFNLTKEGIGKCIETLFEIVAGLKLQVAYLFLGGGGYNNVNSAKLWAYLTSIIIGKPLRVNEDISGEDPYFSLYGPSFDLNITPGKRPNRNHKEYIEEILSIAKRNLEGLPFS